MQAEVAKRHLNSRMQTLKILSFQDTPYSTDINKNLSVVEATATAASILGVDVLVFPELYVTGYNIGNQVAALAEPINGYICSKLKRIAVEKSVAIVIGFPERDSDNIFNSAIAIDKYGNIVGHHRKIFLFGETEKSLFTPGEHLAVFELNGIQCGITICYDIEFPEAIRTLARQGAEIIFNPTANMHPYVEVPKTLARARALENGVTVVYANLCGSEGDIHYTGLSAIIAPDGVDLARAGSLPTLLIAEIPTIKTEAMQNIRSTQLKDLHESKFHPF